MPNLYPPVNLPKIAAGSLLSKPKEYKPAPRFDYNLGDFVRDPAGRMVMASGKEAYAEWCIKQCVTERRTRLAYSGKIGVEMNDALKNSEADPKAVQSAIERTITEALMVNPATEYVRKFEFSRSDGDGVLVRFPVKGRDLEEQVVEVFY